MHIIITDARRAKSRSIHLGGARLLGLAMVLALAALILCAALSHWVLVQGARAGWPGVSALARKLARNESEQDDRFLRENLDMMARRVGEMQARLVQLEALGEHLSGLAGLDSAALRSPPGQGGAPAAGRPAGMEDLQVRLTGLERVSGHDADLLALLESRLSDRKAHSLMLPTGLPVAQGRVGSAFGWRIDPFTGRSALHTGLDYQAEQGTPILAAAGGIVVSRGWQADYGNQLEVDHGNGWVTRYAHASELLVCQGDLVRRGQRIATVGSTGRSTGPHLHFELLAHGVPQDPERFPGAARTLQVVAGPEARVAAVAPSAQQVFTQR